jgi:hypothetical protein
MQALAQESTRRILLRHWQWTALIIDCLVVTDGDADARIVF